MQHPRFLLQASMILLAACFASAGSTAARADNPSRQELAQPGPLGDIALGNKAASLHIYEYGSFTCPHCAKFSDETFPEFKKNYLDTGRAYYVFRPFGFYKDPLAMKAAMLAQCAGPGHNMDFVEMFFRTRRQWSQDGPKQGLKNLKALVIKQGISSDQIESCLKNERVFNHVHIVEQRGAKFGVRKTPTFFINGERYTGAKSYEELDEILREHGANSSAP